jgi:hypothetical protein
MELEGSVPRYSILNQCKPVHTFPDYVFKIDYINFNSLSGFSNR